MKTLLTRFLDNIRLWDEYVYTLKDHVTRKPCYYYRSCRLRLQHSLILLVSEIHNDEHVICLFRIRASNNQIFTIGNLQKINKNDLKYLLEYISAALYIKSDEYMEILIKEIIFSFGIRSGAIGDNKIIDTVGVAYKITFDGYRNYKLPATMDPRKYGEIIHEDIRDDSIFYIVQITPLTTAKIEEIYDHDEW